MSPARRQAAFGAVVAACHRHGLAPTSAQAAALLYLTDLAAAAGGHSQLSGYSWQRQHFTGKRNPVTHAVRALTARGALTVTGDDQQLHVVAVNDRGPDSRTDSPMTLTIDWQDALQRTVADRAGHDTAAMLTEALRSEPMQDAADGNVDLERYAVAAAREQLAAVRRRYSGLVRPADARVDADTTVQMLQTHRDLAPLRERAARAAHRR